MDYLQVVIMAIVQGIAEFLPISSSGHLCVLDDIFKQCGVQHKFSELTLMVVLHFGTLISVFVVFWKRIWRLLTFDRRVIPLLILATIPAALVKICIDDSVLESSLVSGICFPITGLILLWCSNRSGETICRNLSYVKAVLIGLAQGIALFPGISRSGTTISAGLLCGLKREEAATFSFLMAIPAIGGGALVEAVKFLKPSKETTAQMTEAANQTTTALTNHEFFLLGLGMIISFVIGVLALKLLLNWLQHGKLKYFSWWLFILGPVVIIWRLFFAA
ncbi:MAG: undecaprenyl-diphosphate phosphatase [Planctomycetaceae bacterium]|jgi:undecaprenyl-diphosphatase|nr:undecaprenyl-diphosphate phosphatase [Planctomycetaceae bacterium]